MKPTHKLARPATVQSSGLIVRVTQSLAQSTRIAVGAEPVARPVIDRQLPRLPAIERAAEVLRYSVMRAEYWLSPGGTLRAVMRLSLKVALLMGLPVVILGPVVLLLLEGAATASASLAVFAANLAAIGYSLIVAVICFTVLATLGRTLLRHK